jgi:hypothetical protein
MSFPAVPESTVIGILPPAKLVGLGIFSAQFKSPISKNGCGRNQRAYLLPGLSRSQVHIHGSLLQILLPKDALILPKASKQYSSKCLNA